MALAFARNPSNLLTESDWTQISDNALSAQDVTDCATYRTELRDLPNSNNYDKKSYLDVNMNSGSGQDDMKLEADNVGPDGDDISLIIIDPGTASQALSCSVTGNEITVSLATNGSSDIISTIQEVIDVINNDTDTDNLCTASLISGATGTNVVDQVLSETNLAGGSDLYNVLYPVMPNV